MLAGVQRGDGGRGVEIVRRADRDGVQLLHFDHLVVVGEDMLDAVSFGEGFCPFFVDVAACEQLHISDAAVSWDMLALRYSSRADKSDAHLSRRCHIVLLEVLIRALYSEMRSRSTAAGAFFCAAQTSKERRFFNKRHQE